MTAGRGADFQLLVGRDEQRAAVQSLLDALPQAGAALTYAGQRGYGRTSLLAAAESLAASAGIRVLPVRGAMVVRQAGGFLHTVHAHATRPDEAPAAPPEDGRSLHELFRWFTDAMTLAGPVLLTLDDIDLLHPNDVATVAFIARRLSTLPVVMLATSDPTLTDLLERGGLPVHPLGPLTDTEATQVITNHYPRVHPGARDRILAEAAGSPLALIELPKRLTTRQQLGLDALPVTLSLTPRLREVYAEPLTALDGPAQDLLTLLAIGGSAGLFSTLASGRSHLDPSALDQLERAGLVVTLSDEAELRFGHPLVRNAVLDRITDRKMARAREQLAAAFPSDTDEQARRLADAWGKPDGYLASRLERTARRATERGDLDQAVAAMLRAAHLSPDRTVRSRRLLEAAHLQATITGEIGGAADALAEAASFDRGSALSLRAAATSGRLMLLAGGPLHEVAALLIQALSSDSPGYATDTEDAQPCLELLFYLCLMSASEEQWRAFDHLARRHPAIGLTVELLTGVLPDISKTSDATIARLDKAISRLTDSVDPAHVVAVSTAAYQLDRLGPCRAALSRIAEDARRGQTVGLGGIAMLRLALDDCQTGQLSSATRLATEGLELATTLGPQVQLWPFQTCLGLIAALRGEQNDVDALTSQMSAWAAPRGAALIHHHCAHLSGLAALGRGDFEAAYAFNVSINAPGTIAGHTNVTFAACLDLVEAAVHTHREREARAHAAAITEAQIGRLSPRFALRVAAAAAMTASDLQTRELFEHALSIEQVGRWPFDLARVQLAYGSRLRRLHETQTAGGQLNAAYETFRRMGARGWAHRAAEEMRAAGLPRPYEAPPPRTVLTGRDLEIATLAAAGLSNQEIGAQLFLSPRTVGSRLYRIFPKLGVSSRASLRDALDQHSDPHP